MTKKLAESLPSVYNRPGHHIQLFRERLLQKVHATIPKGIGGGFVFTVFQINLKEWHKRPWMYVCSAKGKQLK